MYFRICLVLVAFFAVSQAFLCPPNFCDQVKCKSPELLQNECSDGLVREGASLCGCCHACITQLGENEVCLSHIFGVPSLTECREGLVCLGGRCTRQ